MNFLWLDHDFQKLCRIIGGNYDGHFLVVAEIQFIQRLYTYDFES